MRFQQLQIKRLLLKYIQEGNLTTGEPLPTILHFAKTFHVSPNTVQKAVHALTKEGVIKSIRGKGLFVNSLAPQRDTSLRKVGILHQLGPQYIDSRPWPGIMSEALRKRLADDGYSLIPISLRSINLLNIQEELLKLNLAGLILLEICNESMISDFRELRIPMVAADYDTFCMGISTVVFDNAYGTFIATQHLLEAGHREIAFVRGMILHQIGTQGYLDPAEDQRLLGYRMAMQAAGLPTRIADYERSQNSLQATLLRLFARRPSPTALVFVGDGPASRAAREAMALGFKIPDDLSVVGFGDSDVEFAPGKLVSSVGIDHAAMGRNAAELLLEQLQGDAAGPRRLVVSAELAAHESVAAPPNQAPSEQWIARDIQAFRGSRETSGRRYRKATRSGADTMTDRYTG